MRAAIGPALELLLIVVCFTLLRVLWPSLNLSFAQLLVLPLVVHFYSRLRLSGRRIPPLLLAAAVAAAVTAFTAPYLTGGRNAVLITTLKGDDLENNSRLFAEDLDRFLHATRGMRSLRYYATFQSHAAALKLLAGHRRGIAVVWGNAEWIQVSFGKAAAAHALGDAGQALDLELVTAVPVVGLSYEPRGDTARFIAALTGGMKRLHDGDRGGAEAELRYAAERASLWASNAHRALAWMLLGNVHLEEAFRGGRYQPAMAAYAEKDYMAAAVNMMRSDNPELFSAIHNNLGVLYLLQAYFENKPALVKQARHKWEQALAARNLPNPFGTKYQAPYIARRNLERTRGEVGEMREAKPKRQKAKRKKKKTRASPVN